MDSPDPLPLSLPCSLRSLCLASTCSRLHTCPPPSTLVTAGLLLSLSLLLPHLPQLHQIRNQLALRRSLTLQPIKFVLAAASSIQSPQYNSKKMVYFLPSEVSSLSVMCCTQQYKFTLFFIRFYLCTCITECEGDHSLPCQLEERLVSGHHALLGRFMHAPNSLYL